MCRLGTGELLAKLNKIPGGGREVALCWTSIELKGSVNTVNCAML